MLHVTHRIANTDWTHVSKILDQLPGAKAEKTEAFKRAIFNAVLCNRDDHAKNLSFLRRQDGSWGLSPAYDLCYSPGPGGWHTMIYAGHSGKEVTALDLLRLGQAFGVEEAEVKQWTEQAQHIRSQLLLDAKGMGVEKALLSELRTQFKLIDRALVSRPTRKLRR